MSETVELAGNYAVSGGDGDPEFVAERLQEMQEETTLKQRQTAEFSEVKAKLEEKRDRQRRIIDVMDEPVEFRPVGGRVAQQAMTRWTRTGGPGSQCRLSRERLSRWL